MYKNSEIQRIIAIMLSLIMILALIPVSAAAETLPVVAAPDNESINLIPIHLRTTNDGQVEFSYDGEDWIPYDNVSLAGAIVDTDDETYQHLNNTKAGLKAIATLSGYPGAGAITDGLFGAVFGTETDRVMKALDKISKQLDAIQLQMTTMTAFLASEIKLVSIKNSLEKRIDLYTTAAPVYSTASKTFFGTLELINKLPNETEQEKAHREKTVRDFFIKIVNETTLDGTKFNLAVQKLGYIILQEDDVNQLNLFNAFDKLMLYGFKWEHHGYPYRINFQSHAMGLYTNLAALSLEGLTLAIDEAEKNDDTATKLTLETTRSNLMEQISDIDEMAEAHTVVLRTSKERYYQVPGHELLLEATAIPRTVNPTYPHFPSGWVMNYDLFGGVLCNGPGSVPTGSFNSKNNPNGYLPVPNDGISAPYPSPEWFVSVYNDYGGLKDLYDIFFSEDEGGISKSDIPAMDVNPIPPFVTSSWWRVSLPIVRSDFYFMKRIDKFGKPKDDNALAAVYTSGDALDGIRDWNPNMMIGLVVVPNVKVDPPSNDLNLKITGMETSYNKPYNGDILLSVEDKGDLFRYEWLVDKDNQGFMPIDGANSSSYALGPVNDTMNGYQYRCRITHHKLVGKVESVLTDAVTLILTGTDSSGDSGGSSGYTPPTAKILTDKQPNLPTTAKMSVAGTVKNGVLSGTITEQMVKDAIKASQEPAKKSGQESDGIALDFSITGSGSFESLNAVMDVSAFSRLKEANVKFFRIGSTLLNASFNTGAIAEIDRQATGTITVSATRQSKLSDAAKALIGSRPAFDITVGYQKNGKTEYVTNFNKGAVTLGIAYKAADKEMPGNLFGVYLDTNGNPQLLANSTYADGRVIFSRNSLSTYGVGYKAPAAPFTDTANHWAKDDIDYVANRGVIFGLNKTTFIPDTAITRAHFLMGLGLLSGADVSSYKTSSFTDFKDSDQAMPYAEWAVTNQIVQGIGDNMFGSDQQISRQDMAVMMQNYAKATGYELPVSDVAVAFSDNEKISSYAKEAVIAIQQAGIMQGKGNNAFDPTGNATRGEASTIMRRFVELVISK